MPATRPQFAVVREDPRIEYAVIERYGLSSALVVASGGCTALSLAARYPALRVAAFDFNPTQLAHVRHKQQLVAEGRHKALGVGVSGGVNQCGAFEGLFRVLRHAIEEFVVSPQDMGAWFETGVGDIEAWFASPYWPTAFAMAFSDALLTTMFGPAAVQHAEPGSYPAYFQGVIEAGLRDHGEGDGRHNPYLQHILLGTYLPADAPPYCKVQRPLELSLRQGSLLDVDDLHTFDLVSLSNIFDWSDDDVVTTWAEALVKRLATGAVIVIRQLNNQRDLRRFFEPHFTFDGSLAQELLEQDRSLFYNRIEIGRRVATR